MSNSEGPALQQRSLTAHAQHGEVLRKVCFPRSTDIDLRQTYPRRRQVATTPSPTAETLPPTEAASFTARPEVHKDQRYRKTAFPMKRAPHGKSHPDPEFRQTRVIGKEKRTDEKRWKTPKVTAKTEAKRARAAEWLAKHG